MSERITDFHINKSNNINRFLNLLKLDFNLYGRQIFLGPIIVNIVFIFLTLLNLILKVIILKQPYFGSKMNLNFYIGASLIIGAILSANSFKHIHKEESAIQFYMTAASIFEKFISIWLYYFLFYTILSILGTLIAFLINNIIIFLFTGRSFPISMILSLFDYKIILSYFLNCSIFMLGSTYFKKNSFFKTILAILAISFIFSILILIAFSTIFKDQYIQLSINIINLLQSFGLDDKAVLIVVNLVQFILSIFFYLITYIRILEYDVKGE